MPDVFREVLLRNPTRKHIVTLLEGTPGLNKNQLARAVGMNANGLEFHLGRLERAGIVETRPGGREKETLCFTPENVHLWEDESTRVLFGRGLMRQVAAYLAEHPAAEVADVAGAVGLTASTVRRYIRVLERHELVQRMRIDRQVLYHAAPGLRQRVREIGGTGLGDRER